MSATSSNIIAIMLLLATNAFFVAAKFALVKARGIRLETNAVNGSVAARLSLQIQSKLEDYLAACQLGITMASLGLGWVGGSAVAKILEPAFVQAGIPQPALHTAVFIAGLLVFSSMHIIFGEQVPRTLAIRSAERVSVWVAYPLHFVYVLGYPLNWLLGVSSSFAAFLFKVEETSREDIFCGETGEDKATMLRNTLEFDQRRVGRVMIPYGAVKFLDISGSAARNLAVICDSCHSRFPVTDSADNDAVVGIVFVKDLYIAGLIGDAQPWRDLTDFCHTPLLVPESQKVAFLFERMREYQTHMALVVNEHGGLAGIVTLEDLIEEIVGDIRDETDPDAQAAVIVELDPGRWIADGLAPLAEIERAIAINIPDEVDANTLSGLFMFRLSRMPEVGDWIEEGDFRLIVRSLDGNQVGQVGIERIFDPGDLEPLDAW